jgi:hypothetical protein
MRSIPVRNIERSWKGPDGRRRALPFLFTLLCSLVLVGLLGMNPSAGASQRQSRLGGSWIGHSVLGTWTALQIPTNPEGTQGALRVNFTSYGANVAGLAASFGADSLSDFVGEEVMIDRDTAQWRLVGYAQAKGPGNEVQIRAILVGFGTLRFIDADHYMIDATLTAYPAAADADGDGLPDSGAGPVVTIPGIVETGQRVRILQ